MCSAAMLSGISAIDVQKYACADRCMIEPRAQPTEGLLRRHDIEVLEGSWLVPHAEKRNSTLSGLTSAQRSVQNDHLSVHTDVT
jgi:hypothetical protein